MTSFSRTPYFPPAATTKEFALLLATATMEIWDSCLVGNPAPAVQRRYELMKNPRPGDLVLEISSCGRKTWPGRALGYLIFVCKAKPRTAEEWLDAVDAGYWKMDSVRGYGPYWLVDPIDGSQRTFWNDARFIRVPEPQEPVRGPVVFTRESIVAKLSDIGVELK